MPKFNDELVELLKTEPAFVSAEGRLLKNVVTERALALNPDLIRLLRGKKNIAERFFKKIDDVVVFDRDDFVRFLNLKDFLPDSYTSFEQKIGLATPTGGLLSKDESVVLNWPYKDCVLEGDMKKEDEKRDEVFYNETLAPDEIDRLLEPKALTNFKKYDKDGEHKVTGFTHGDDGVIKDNLIIRGNNLLALHSLEKEFAGKVKLIYIDPPYNTESADDSFRYNDSFNHSTWLTFMRNRLESAKRLLDKDGAIYIQLDYNEVHYCKVLADEIFGRDNFQREIIWRIGWVSGYKSADKNWIRNHDTILFYSKNKDSLRFIKKYIPYPADYKRRDGKKPEGDGYPIEDTWNCSDVDTLHSIAIVSFSKEKVGEFKGQKNEELLKRVIEAHTEKGDIVLDFFGGVGSTAAAAHKMGRRWISCEQLDFQVGKQLERLRSVVIGDKVGISKMVDWKGGGEFIYCELKENNAELSRRIRAAETKDALKEIWNNMKATGFLSYRIDPKKIDEHAADFADLSIADQKRFLDACLEKNHLYVNLSDLDDESFHLAADEKKLNKSFYGLQ